MCDIGIEPHLDFKGSETLGDDVDRFTLLALETNEVARHFISLPGMLTRPRAGLNHAGGP
jgi:hypothetical protein